MLKYKDIIDNLTIKQKIAILTSSMDAEELRALKIPSVQIADLWDGNQLDSGEAIFPSAKSLANSWDDQLFGNVCLSLSAVQAKNNGTNLFVMPSTVASTSAYSNALSEEPFLCGSLVGGAMRLFKQKSVPSALISPMLKDEDVKTLDIEADLPSVYERSVAPYRIAERCGEANAVIIPENCESKTYNEANEKLLSFVSPSYVQISKLENGDQTTQEVAKGRQLIGGSLSAIEASYDNYQRIYRSMQEGGASPFELQMTLSDGAAISDEMIDNLLDQRLELAYFCERNTPKAKNDEIAGLSYAAARDSIVLLKNQNVLPIKRGERVALVGDIVSTVEEGSFRGFVDELSKRLAAEGMAPVGYAPGYILSRDRSEDMIPQAVNLCKGADTILVFVGLGKTREAGLQRTHRLSLPANQKALISALVKLRKKVVCVVVGEHLPAMSFDKRAQATLFIPSQGKGVVKALSDIVCGRYSPCGRLASAGYDDPDDDFRTSERLKKEKKKKVGPFVGYRYIDSSNNTIRYPFGHGLSYTSFVYSNLIVSETSVTFSIYNAGNIQASDVVQLYVGKPDSKRVRPKKTLKASCKITLKPHERRQVTLKLTDLGIYDEKRGDTIVEDGKYEILVGSSPASISLKKTIDILGEKLSPQKFNFSDYLYSVSNIRSEGYTMEAPCINMNRKSKLKLTGILFLAITLFADVVYGVGGLLTGIDFAESILALGIISAIGLLTGGIILLVHLIKTKRARVIEEQLEREAAEELFRDVEKIDAHSVEELFVEEFDALYEEEQRQDEQSFAKDESTYAYMAVETDLKSASIEMEKFFEESGLSITIEASRAILSAIMSSRLLVIRTDKREKYEKLLSVLSKYFGTEAHEDSFANYNGTGKTLWQGGNSPLAETISAGELEENRVHFLSIRDIKLADAGKILMPYLQYLSNPEEGQSFLEDGEAIPMPSNVWFIVSPADNESLDTIPAYVSNASMTIDLECQICQEKSDKTPHKLLTCPQIEALLYRSKKASEIDEELWKNIDKLEEFVNDKAPYHIGNKLCLQLESYMSVCESAGAPLSEAIDGAISAKLLPTILSILKDNPEMADIDLAETLESIFGDENVSRCRSMIKHNVIKMIEDDTKKQKPKTEVKEEAKPEAKVEAKVEEKADAKPEAKAETKVEVNAEEKPETKVEPKAEEKPEVKAESKTDNKQTKEEKPQGESKDVK